MAESMTKTSERDKVARRLEIMKNPAWAPSYDSWRHGGWYVGGVYYPSGACGCVSRHSADRKWRIVCDPRPGDHTYRNRDEAAQAEREIGVRLCTWWLLGHDYGSGGQSPTPPGEGPETEAWREGYAAALDEAVA